MTMLEFVKQYFTSVITALAIMSVAYLIFWVALGKKLSNRKIQLSKRAGWAQIKGEIVTSLLSFIGSTTFMFIILLFKDNGLTKFYVDGGNFGWHEALTVVIMILLSDAWFYWLHRAMHHPAIYKYVHALHHKSLDVNPYTSTSFHVLEAVALTVWVLPLVMVMPISMTALGIVQVLGILNNLKSHLGYEFFPGFFNKVPPLNMLVTATNHSLHHTQYRGNYGLFFRFWDIICGTELTITNRTFTEIHLRKNENVIDNTRYRKLTIDKIVRENSNAVSIYFKPIDKAFYNYSAGQYITIKVKVEGKTYTRCFSLSSSPAVDDFLRITVKLKGKVSHYFYYAAQVGDTIESLLPVGDFTFCPSATATKQYILVAGGSGITPLFSMIKQMLNFEPASTVTLLYANADKAHITFQDALHKLTQQFPQFKYIDFISGEKRISKEDLKSTGNATYFICGPYALKDGMMEHLKDLGVSKENINIEHFADGYTPWFGLFQKGNYC
jgi:ring-1,2-phenylacetyl-CoA epoxidase subunit PaaE